MLEDKVGAQSSESAELGLRERKKTGVPASSKEDCNITPFLHSSPRLDLDSFRVIQQT